MISALRRFTKTLALQVADRLATLYPLRKKSFSAPKSVCILMLRPLGLGDLMMLSPFISEIAERFKYCSTYLVTEHDKFMDLPRVIWIKPIDLNKSVNSDRLIISPTLSWKHLPFLRGSKFIIGYFFSNRITSNFCNKQRRYNARNGHYFERAELILSALEPWQPSAAPLRYSNLITAPAKNFVRPKCYVCVAPYSNWAERQYPLEYYQLVISELTALCTVVLIGGNHPDEIRMAEVLSGTGIVNMVGNTNFSEAVSLIKGANLFIGNDSGLAHVAFLSKTPSIVVFGCVSGSQRLPIDEDLSNRVLALGAGNLCTKFPCYDGYNKPTCKNNDRYICLRGINPNTVSEHALKLLSIETPSIVNGT